MSDGSGPTRGSRSEAFLITEAPESLEAQHKARVRKYLMLMAFRVPALVIAGIVYSSTGSGLLALAIVAASIPIPWVAVLIANDRPPRKRGEKPQYTRGDPHPPGPQPLGSAVRTLDNHPTIDSEAVESTPGDSHPHDAHPRDPHPGDSHSRDSHPVEHDS